MVNFATKSTNTTTMASILAFSTIIGGSNMVPWENYELEQDNPVSYISVSPFLNQFQNSNQVQDAMLSLNKFFQNLMQNTKNLDSNIVEVVNDHFWELI